MIFLLLLILLGYTACQSEEPEMTSDYCQDGEVSFNEDIKSIFSTNCSNLYCHGSEPGFASYEYIKRVVDNGLLWEKFIETREMPPSAENSLDFERDQIACWIESGALNN